MSHKLQYRNLLFTLMMKRKQAFYDRYFENNWKNIKNTWKEIKSIISLKTVASSIPTVLSVSVSVSLCLSVSLSVLKTAKVVLVFKKDSLSFPCYQILKKYFKNLCIKDCIPFSITTTLFITYSLDLGNSILHLMP